MLAILGGLGAAFAWALSTLSSSRSSRLIDPIAVVAWVMLVGLVITAPLAAAAGVPGNLHGSALVWLALSGAGNVGGLMLAYHALRVGQVSVVAPVVSTEGAIAAVISVLAGQSMAPSVGVALMGIAVGIGLATTAGVEPGAAARAVHLRSLLLAAIAAAAFGVSLYATGRAGARLPTSWVVLAARLIGALALAVPLAARGRLRLTAAAAPLVIVAGACEVAGFYAYTLGSRHGLAIAAVLGSQFAVVALVGSYVLFGERLGRMQLAGVACMIVGVAALSALRA